MLSQLVKNRSFFIYLSWNIFFVCITYIDIPRVLEARPNLNQYIKEVKLWHLVNVSRPRFLRFISKCTIITLTLFYYEMTHYYLILTILIESSIL